MRNNVMIDQIRGHIRDSFIFCGYPNLPVAKPELPTGICDSGWTFLTKMAPMRSPVSVHWEFAEGEEFREEIGANDSFRVRRAALKPTNV